MKPTEKRRAGRAKTFIIVIVQVSIFVYLIENRFYLGILLYCILFAGLIIWKKWDVYLMVKQHMEIMIFGKPLKRELWRKGELKKLKFRLVWGKKKSQ